MSCRYPGCTVRPTVDVSPEEAWCRPHAAQEATKLARQFVMQRDRRICQRCGGGAHDAAHLIPKGRAPYIRYEVMAYGVGNIVGLCRPCHQAIDGSPSMRNVWVEQRWPGLLAQLHELEWQGERNRDSVDLAAVIRGFGERELTPEEMTRYTSGAWLGL